MTRTPSALDAFITAKAAIDGLLARLTALSADHFHADPESIHWGNIGDLEDIRARLQEIADRACREGEYAA